MKVHHAFHTISAAENTARISLGRLGIASKENCIPMIDDLLCSFDDMLKTDFVIRNPLISCGISEARSKLLEYYPIQDESIKRLEPLYLAMVLDPRFKRDLSWGWIFGQQGRND